MTDSRYQEMIERGAKALGYTPPIDGLLGSGMSKMLATSNAKDVLDAAGVPAFLERIVVVDIDGRTVLMDTIAEAEAALDSVQAALDEMEHERDLLRDVALRIWTEVQPDLKHRDLFVDLGYTLSLTGDRELSKRTEPE